MADQASGPSNVEIADLLDQWCRELIEIGVRTVKLRFDHPSMREAHAYRLAFLRRATTLRRSELLETYR